MRAHLVCIAGIGCHAVLLCIIQNPLHVTRGRHFQILTQSGRRKEPRRHLTTASKISHDTLQLVDRQEILGRGGGKQTLGNQPSGLVRRVPGAQMRRFKTRTLTHKTEYLSCVRCYHSSVVMQAVSDCARRQLSAPSQTKPALHCLQPPTINLLPLAQPHHPHPAVTALPLHTQHFQSAQSCMRTSSLM